MTGVQTCALPICFPVTIRRAYIIADNRLALDAGWDEEMLRVEFAELADDGFNLELTGFELGEITNINLDDESLTLNPYLSFMKDKPNYFVIYTIIAMVSFPFLLLWVF